MNQKSDQRASLFAIIIVMSMADIPLIKDAFLLDRKTAQIFRSQIWRVADRLCKPAVMKFYNRFVSLFLTVRLVKLTEVPFTSTQNVEMKDVLLKDPIELEEDLKYWKIIPDLLKEAPKQPMQVIKLLIFFHSRWSALSVKHELNKQYKIVLYYTITIRRAHLNLATFITFGNILQHPHSIWTASWIAFVDRCAIWYIRVISKSQPFWQA